MANETIQINRAPVFTLWAAIVAERLGQVEVQAHVDARAPVTQRST